MQWTALCLRLPQCNAMAASEEFAIIHTNQRLNGINFLCPKVGDPSNTSLLLSTTFYPTTKQKHYILTGQGGNIFNIPPILDVYYCVGFPSHPAFIHILSLGLFGREIIMPEHTRSRPTSIHSTNERLSQLSLPRPLTYNT